VSSLWKADVGFNKVGHLVEYEVEKETAKTVVVREKTKEPRRFTYSKTLRRSELEEKGFAPTRLEAARLWDARVDVALASAERSLDDDGEGGVGGMSLLDHLQTLVDDYSHLTGKSWEDLRETHLILLGVDAWEEMWDQLASMYPWGAAGHRRYSTRVEFGGIVCLKDVRLSPRAMLCAGRELAPGPASSAWEPRFSFFSYRGGDASLNEKVEEFLERLEETAPDAGGDGAPAGVEGEAPQRGAPPVLPSGS
jgi:hypothetical protein